MADRFATELGLAADPIAWHTRRTGRDGAIKHVMSGVNPQGCQGFSFKHPTATERPLELTIRQVEHLSVA